jgi:tetratricopeptide (TPR) repeat protein
MQGGLYASAVEQYEAAEQMAPNNPLIWLGRAHAALGAGYYALAEAQLRRSLSADPTLLMGQYDLKRMVGADRLAYLVSDLKTIASRDQRNHVPMVLLAYIAYNLGRESEASDWLQTAHTRSGGDDLLVRILREHWHGAAPAQRKTPRPE